jgi:hypothetical protein
MLANDGQTYVVKSINNPQKRRTLVNEWVANALFRNCGLAVAWQSPITIPGDVLAGLRADSEAARWWPDDSAVQHFGSRLVVNPGEQAIYDVIPDPLLPTVVNLSDFVGALVLDVWLGNIDVRQAVFFRGQTKHLHGSSRQHGNSRRLSALLIDHGQCFGGASWKLRGCQPVKPFPWGNVYAGIASQSDFTPWLDRVAEVTLSDLESISTSIPTDWIAGEAANLDELFSDLLNRRSTLPRLLAEVGAANPHRFPNWQRS